jgi:hypothetical protein
MEYAKRPRLPPPFVVISYIGKIIVQKKLDKFLFILGMLINSCSRQCVLKLKDYSDKRTIARPRSRAQLSSIGIDTYHTEENSTNIPLVPTTNTQLNDTSIDIIEDRSLLGRLLNCNPCRQVTENQRHKNVCSIEILYLIRTSFYRN